MNYSVITLDASLRAKLDWTEEKKTADLIIKEGKKILWNLQLGLFNKLDYSFSHQSQFLSLRLSLEHFKDTIWPNYGMNSIGASVYSGDADFKMSFPWDQEQITNLQEWLQQHFHTIANLNKEVHEDHFENFIDLCPKKISKTINGQRLLSLFCRDASIDYLHLLTAELPDEIPLFVNLEIETLTDYALLFQLTSAELYGRITPLIPSDIKDGKANYAICLPPSNLVAKSAVEGLSDAVMCLKEKKIPFKIIPESNLIAEWDELDYLFVCTNGLGPQGLRKLQGFCAAGGTVIAIGELLHLPFETAFNEWRKS